MSDKFSPLPLPALLKLSLSEVRRERFLGIPGSLFFKPLQTDPFRMERYGKMLETPFGVAAGPHTQMAQNIIAAWLCGARYIELKTIQTLDELDVAKPCIDMQDEGYNCEWSQELKVKESFEEYLKAWIIIHILKKELGFDGPLGTIFNMSVGYNLEGILKENVQWFFRKMKDCSEELDAMKQIVRKMYPDIDNLNISPIISDNVTLSTMHGCPPDEIGKIGLYLIKEKKLHTTVKLNPTLLGAEELRSLLNDELGFKTPVPDLAFEHDLKYPEALELINMLTEAAKEEGLLFSLKLTNTLESLNHRDIFGKEQQMMYMSGRALHPISIKLSKKLQEEFEGELDISFSAGVDCFNIGEVLACGLKPVTVCSDLLKPGGYGRLWQYAENLRKEFAGKSAKNIEEFIISSSNKKEKNIKKAALENLQNYAARVAENPAYKVTSFIEPSIKTARPLGSFDCIHAPCTDTCPTNQAIPEYMFHTAEGNNDAAFEAIFDTNPFPSVTGMVCDHLCQLKCTRINYDSSLKIREIKRYIAENQSGIFNEVKSLPNGKKAAIIGAGPAGLSCAWFLNKAGFEINVYEQKKVAGGMVSGAIPSFRLTDEAIGNDIQRIISSGVHLHENHKINKENFDKIYTENDVVFLAAGAQKSAPIELEGINSKGVLDPLDFLFNVKQDKATGLGRNVVIIGGGNTAMDAARTAYRLVGKEGKVSIIYRRTIKEMPADQGEIKAVLEEGMEIIELVNPERIIIKEGKIGGIICSGNILGEKDKSGRPRPVKVPGSEFEIACETVIPAIGQQSDLDFLSPEKLKTKERSYKTAIEKLYTGGDAMRGASTAINAIADGRKAAAEIIADLEIHLPSKNKKENKKVDIVGLLHKKAIRIPAVSIHETPRK